MATLAFLAAFALCGLVGIEAWPFSGWRLFSTLRGPVDEHLVVETVDDQGVAHPLPASLGHGYSGPIGRSVADDQRAADAVAAAVAGSTGQPVSAVRVVRVQRDLRTGSTTSQVVVSRTPGRR